MIPIFRSSISFNLSLNDLFHYFLPPHPLPPLNSSTFPSWSALLPLQSSPRDLLLFPIPIFPSSILLSPFAFLIIFVFSSHPSSSYLFPFSSLSSPNPPTYHLLLIPLTPSYFTLFTRLKRFSFKLLPRPSSYLWFPFSVHPYLSYFSIPIFSTFLNSFPLLIIFIFSSHPSFSHTLFPSYHFPHQSLGNTALDSGSPVWCYDDTDCGE